MRSPYPDTEVILDEADSQLLRRLLTPPGRGTISITRDVQLIPEIRAPGARSVVTVRIDGAVLGHLDHQTSQMWSVPLNRIIDSGHIPITIGNIWAYEQLHWGAVDSEPTSDHVPRVNVALGDPDAALPINDPPEVAYTLVPRSGIIQVTKQTDYRHVLIGHVPATGYGMLFATLRETDGATAKSNSVVEVCVDGERVGLLTPSMSANYLPLIQHLRSRGLETACWADLEGSAVAAKIRIDAAKAHEVDDLVLDGPPVNLPRLVPADTETSRTAQSAGSPSESELALSRSPAAEPPIGSVVRWTVSGYTFLAIRDAENWLTTATATSGNRSLPQQRESWQSIVRCTDLRLGVEWRYPTSNPRHGDALWYRTARGLRAALKIVIDGRATWYVTGDGVADDGIAQIMEEAEGTIFAPTRWETIHPAG